MMTIFGAIVAFLVQEKAGIASKVIASATYDFLKKNLNFNGLKSKIGGLFKSEKDSDKFIEQLCEKPVSDNFNNDIIALYSNVTGNTAPESLLKLIEEWIKENKESIENINNIQISNSSGFNIGVQNARRDIINIQGDYNPKDQTNGNQ